MPRTQTQVTIGNQVRYSAVWWKPARALETKVYGFPWTEAEYVSRSQLYARWARIFDDGGVEFFEAGDVSWSEPSKAWKNSAVVRWEAGTWKRSSR